MGHGNVRAELPHPPQLHCVPPGSYPTSIRPRLPGGGATYIIFPPMEDTFEREKAGIVNNYSSRQVQNQPFLGEPGHLVTCGRGSLHLKPGLPAGQ